jgi:hypothetical protein
VSAKHHKKPPRLVEVDVDYDLAREEFDRKARSLEHGLVYLVVAKHGFMTIGYQTKVSHNLPEDTERLMRGKPGWD